MRTCISVLNCIVWVLLLTASVAQADPAQWQVWLAIGGGPGGPGEYHTLATGQIGAIVQEYSAELVVSGSVKGSDSFSEASLLLGRQLEHSTIQVHAQAGPTIIAMSDESSSRDFGFVLGLHVVWHASRFLALGFRPLVSINGRETYGAAVVQLELGKF